MVCTYKVALEAVPVLITTPRLRYKLLGMGRRSDGIGDEFGGQLRRFRFIRYEPENSGSFSMIIHQVSNIDQQHSCLPLKISKIELETIAQILE